MKFIVRTLVSALALWLTSLLLPGIEAPAAQSDTQFALYLLGIGAIFTLVSMIIRPIIVVLSIPFYILTLGLWALVVNALILLLSSWIADQFGWGMTVDGFWWAVAGGLVVAIIIMIIDAFLPKSLRR
ncbi:phage holin family protein [Flaviflexus salsibiostraticola]|uniref:Phage holin family protein n=1 Tax=Flaviflexus salsibiostraticola TaxID=1282737 RepID=A0A3Q8WTX8_9ACTO|nr:phage holin family protein [Flaviflexus salsibiostraticola]AZN30225.1 phage holin family protein [Flaviflexus salsibiostraticola]